MNPFAEFDLPVHFDINLQELEQVYLAKQALYHPDKHVKALPTEQVLAQKKAICLNQSYGILKNPVTRARALLQHQGIPIPGDNGSTIESPELLMEMMSWREQLAECKSVQACHAFFQEIQKDFETACKAFQLAPAGPQYLRLSYLDKLLTEAKALIHAHSTY
jgi:molecular chaperone HscB